MILHAPAFLLPGVPSVVVPLFVGLAAVVPLFLGYVVVASLVIHAVALPWLAACSAAALAVFPGASYRWNRLFWGKGQEEVRIASPFRVR